ncbi:WhiB family transcriptional regulator [Streptomyces sp. NPDC057806]|uniref:WhiB family transcriptional regulator n=1 Tax=unclassified Streptomyces TaxID=2593676 RepID=UPI0020229BE9|nr:WhiB family transcriptional regulator [Streptomyces sp. YS415]MCL7429609.1 WhiB family transcriptional regulator [Streptomyces sp. YS415]
MDDWRGRAACRQEDPDLFFPIGTSGPALMQTEQAKAVCRRCPVQEQCLSWALDTRQTVGVWGATTETERVALLRRRASARRRSG